MMARARLRRPESRRLGQFVSALAADGFPVLGTTGATNAGAEVVACDSESGRISHLLHVCTILGVAALPPGCDVTEEVSHLLLGGRRWSQRRRALEHDARPRASARL